MQYKDDPEFIKAIEMIYKDIINVFQKFKFRIYYSTEG